MQRVASILKIITISWSFTVSQIFHTHNIYSRSAQGDSQNDFNEFNDFLGGIIIKFSDTSLRENSIMEIQGLKCDNMSISTIDFSHTPIESKKLSMSFEVKGVSLACTLNLVYESVNIFQSVIKPKNANVFFDVSNVALVVATTFMLESDELFMELPSSAQIDSCEFDFGSNSIDISGSFINEVTGKIIGFLALRPIIMNIIETQLCDLIIEIGSQKLNSFVQNIKSYLETLQSETIDPLGIQKALSNTEAAALIDFTNTINPMSAIYNQFVMKMNCALGRVVHDRSRTDLAINSLLRAKILSPENTLCVSFEDLPIAPIQPSSEKIIGIANEELPFVDIRVNDDGISSLGDLTLLAIQVRDLDSFKRILPLEIVSRQTQRTEFEMDSLDVEFDMKLDIGPSEIYASPGSVRLTFPERVERLQAGFKVLGLKGTISFFLGVNQNMMDNLQLNALLHTNCALNFVEYLNFTELNIGFDEYEISQIQGLISPGIDQLTMNLIDTFDDMYDIGDLIPVIVLTVGREMLQNETNKIIGCFSHNTCPKYVTPTTQSFIDFRDLFLNQELALKAGASGRMPYGDTVSKTMELFNEKYLLPDENGFPNLNRLLIGPTTRLLSNTTGYLNLAIDLNCALSMIQTKFRLSLIDIEFAHLNSFNYPIKIFDPRRNSPHFIDNELTFGSGDDPLSIGLRFAVSMNDKGVETYNDMRVKVDLADVYLSASISAKVDEQRFMEFPILDIANPFCWGAIIPDLSLDDFQLLVKETKYSFECVSCDNVALNDISKVLDILKSAGTLDVISSKLYEVINEEANSPDNGSWLNEVLMGARKGCPHDPLFDPLFDMDTNSFECQSVLSLPMPSLAKNTIELMILLSAVSLQGSIALITKILNETNRPTTDNLFEEEISDTSADEELIDFSNIPVLKTINPILASKTEDSDSPTGYNLQINIMLRSLILNRDGVLNLKLPGLATNVGDIRLSLEAVQIRGLDKFFSFDLLNVLGPQTIESNIGIEEIQLDLIVGVNRELVNKMETMTISISMVDVELNIKLLLSLYKKKFTDLQLGSFLRTTTVLPCLFSAIHSCVFTDLFVKIGNINDVSLAGFVSNEIETAISDSSKALFEEYNKDLSELITEVFSTNVKDRINGMIVDYKSNLTCPTLDISESLSSGFLDFRDLLLSPREAAELGGLGTMPYGDIIYLCMNFVRNILFTPGVDGLPKLNDDVIGPLTRSLSSTTGKIRYPANYFNFTYVFIGLNADRGTVFETSAFDLRIENLDSFGYPLQLLGVQRENPFIVENRAVIGATSSNNFTLSTRFVFDITTPATNSSNDLDISVQLKGLALFLSLLLKISSSSFMSFPLRDMTNINCWLATISPRMLDEFGVALDNSPTIALAGLQMSIEDLGIKIRCVSCSSPEYENLESILSSVSAKQRIKELISTLDSSLLAQLPSSDFLQFQIDRYLSGVSKNCPHHSDFSDPLMIELSKFSSFKTPDPGSDAIRQLIIVITIILSIVSIMFCIAFVLSKIKHHRYQNYIRSLTDEEVFQLYEKKTREERDEQKLCDVTTSLYKSEIIPEKVRNGVPIVILVCILFFVSCHISLSGEVVGYVNIAGELNYMVEIYRFKATDAVRDAWNASGKLLAVLITLTSIIWPYAKQTLSLLLWCLPPSRISVKRRGSLLLLLDNLGKWSIFDLFTVMMFLAAFRIPIRSPKDTPLFPEKFVDVNVLMDIRWGFYANMIAQVISQICSHIVIFYHRKVVKAGMNLVADERSSQSPGIDSLLDDQKSVHSISRTNESNRSMSRIEVTSPEKSIVNDKGFNALCDHTFELDGNKKTLKASRFINQFFAIYCVATIGFLVIGVSLPVMKLEINGLMGIAVTIGADNGTSIAKYSILGFARLMAFTLTSIINTVPVFVGLLAMTILLLYSTVFVGVVLVYILGSIWLKPMSNEERDRMRDTAEIFLAWQYMDVFLISTITLISQIGSIGRDFSTRLCGEAFENLGDLFASAVHFNVLSQENARCFYIMADFQAGVFILMVYSFMLSLLKNFVLSAHAQYKDDLKSANKDRDKCTKLVMKETTSVDEEMLAFIQKKNSQAGLKFVDKFAWLLGLSKISGENSIVGLAKPHELIHSALTVKVGKKDIT